MPEKTYKNPFTGRNYLGEKACIAAIERENGDQIKSFGITARQAIFNSRNRLPINTRYGKSVLSGKPTEWNEQACRYQRFANESERAQYRKIFLERMRRVHGKDHLLDDPNHQRVMLANRSISGQYTFADKTVKTYTGKEEKALLAFLDTALNWPGADIHCPAPQNFRYKDAEGRERFYIPDVYIETLNLIVEVKGEMHNGYRLRDLDIERTKDEVLATSGYNYVKVEDQSFFDLMDVIIALKSDT